MGDSRILMGKRQFFFFSKESRIQLEGWSFIIPATYKLIAGGNDSIAQMPVSLYRESEKMAQLYLVTKKKKVKLSIQAISSDVIVEICEQQRMVTLIEKDQRINDSL